MNAVLWIVQAQPLLKDRRKFTLMADPLLKGNYPTKGLYQALAVAAMCLQEEASTRPLMSDVVIALEYLSATNTTTAEEEEEEEEGEDTSNNNEDEIKDTASSDGNISGTSETDDPDDDADNGESDGKKTTKKKDDEDVQ